MKDNIFIDTNIIIYYKNDNDNKREIINELFLLNDGFLFVSHQVLHEFISASIRKKFFSQIQLEKHLENIYSTFNC